MPNRTIFRAALEGCETSENGGKIGLHIVRYLWRFWQMRGFLIEGRERITRILALPDAQEQNEARGDALNGAGNLAIAQGNYPDAQILHTEALAIRRRVADEKGITGSLNNLGIVAMNLGDNDTARRFTEESLARYRATEQHAAGIGMTLSNLGRLAQKQREFPASLLYLEEALAVNRAIGNRSGESLNLGNLGVTASLQGDAVQAERCFLQALDISRELGDRAWQTTLLCNLGNILCDRNELDAAEEHFAESLALSMEIGRKVGVWLALDGFAFVAIERANYAEAVRRFSAAKRLWETSGNVNRQIDRAEFERALDVLREHLGAEVFTQIWEAARETPAEQIVRSVLQSVSRE